MTRPKTRILLDGGDPQETLRVKELLGFVDGQTTNPSLLANNPHIKRKHPTALYYYRELQNLRDPLHFLRAYHPAQATKNTGSVSSPKGQSFRCINTQRLMASRNSCSLTAGKEQYGAGLCVEAVPPKSKKDSLRPGNKQHP